MVASFKVYDVSIPWDNGYAKSPKLVLERVVPHLQQLEPLATMEHLGDIHWSLSTPHLGADDVANILVTHYGFEVAETQGIIK